jgi:3-oxoacyl-[acyl-carrier protein] reductase
MTAALSSVELGRIKSRSPLGRFATVDEVSAAVEFLLSVDAAGITGTVNTVDAGATA